MRNNDDPTSPSQTMIYKWFKEFDKGRTNLFDLPRIGRSKLFEKNK